MPAQPILLILCLTLCSWFQYLAYWQYQKMQRAWHYLQTFQVQPDHPSLETANLEQGLEHTKAARIQLKQQFLNDRYAYIEHPRDHSIIALSHYNNTYYATDLGPPPSNSSAQQLIQSQQQKKLPLLRYPCSHTAPSPANTITSWPLKLTFRDLAKLAQQLQHPVHPEVLLSSNSTLYQTLSNQSLQTQKVARHISYAIQFSIFGWLTCLYYYLLTQKSRHAHQTSP